MLRRDTSECRKPRHIAASCLGVSLPLQRSTNDGVFVSGSHQPSPTAGTANTFNDVTTNTAAAAPSTSSNQNGSFTTTLQQNKEHLRDLFNHAMPPGGSSDVSSEMSSAAQQQLPATPARPTAEAGSDDVDKYKQVNDPAALQSLVRMSFVICNKL